MKTLNPKQLLIALVAIFGVMLASNTMAQLTTADDTISNTAELTFSVGASNLELESSDSGNETLGDGNGTPTDFEVDRLIDFTVAEVSSDYNSDDTAFAADGQDDIVLEFELSNDSNAAMGFDLHAEVNGTGITEPAGFTTPGGAVFTPTGVTIAVDANDDGIYDGGDTATVIDTVAQEDTVRVFVILDVPEGTDQDDYAFVTLVAQAAEPGGGASTLITQDDNGRQSPGDAGPASDIPDDSATVQDVFADAAGDASYNFVGGSTFTQGDDGAGNGQASDTDGVVVNGPRLSLDKDVAVIWDPINANDNPKAIPGAYLQYTLRIENTAAAATIANLTTLTDSLPTELTFDTGLLAAGCTDVTAPGATCDSFDTDFTADYGNSTTVAYIQFDDDIASPATFDYEEGYANGAIVTIAGQDITIDFSAILTDANVDPDRDTDGDLQGQEGITITFNAILD